MKDGPDERWLADVAMAQRLRLESPVVSARELLIYRVLLRDQPVIVELVHAVLTPLEQARGGAEPLLTTLQAYFEGPVVVVRGQQAEPPARRVVVGVDGSDESVRAVRLAHEAAVHRGAELEVVHAWTLPYMGFAGTAALPQETIDELAVQAGETLKATIDRAGVEATRTRLVQGPPVPALLEAAEGADLLVVGSRGHGGWKGLLMGSVSQQVVTRSTAPVTVVTP